VPASEQGWKLLPPCDMGANRGKALILLGVSENAPFFSFLDQEIAAVQGVIKMFRDCILLSCSYTSGHPCLQGGVLERPFSLGQDGLCKGWYQRTFVSFGQIESCTCALLLFLPCGMSEEKQQRLCIVFCVKLGRNGAEIFEMLRTVFNEQYLGRARIFEWHKRFKEG